MIKVSVIIPVYNVEKYLPKCLNGLINQTLKELEIICINDSSTDRSLDILKEYQEKDNRVKIISLNQNTGAGHSRNEGLKIAKGEYIGFVDPDDTVDLDFFNELYNKASQNNLDISKGSFVTINNGIEVISNLNETIKSTSKYSFIIEYTSAIFKASLIFDNNIRFPEELIISEDMVFLQKAVIKAKSMGFSDKVNYYYIKRENSLYSGIYDETNIDSSIKSVDYFIQNCNNALNKEFTKDVYTEQYWTKIFYLLEFLLKKCTNKVLKIKCIEKFLELYSACPLKQELKNYAFQKTGESVKLFNERNTEEIYRALTKFDSFEAYNLVTKLRRNINKDLKNA